METPIRELSGSELRKLMVRELNQFIFLLDNCTTEKLESQKAYLSEIFARLSQKEQEEVQHLVSLVSELAIPTHPQLHSKNATILPAFNPPGPTLSASPALDDSTPSALQQSA